MSDLRVSFPKPCSERWDGMRSEGCNRFCERCEKTIYDLSHLTVEEVEELAGSGSEICVRARVGPDGQVELKRGHSARRMVATIGSSVGLLAASSHAVAGTPKLGAIKGQIFEHCGSGTVSATAADGRIYRARIGSNDRYKLKRLPAGPYEVKVDVSYPSPDDPKATKVSVEAGQTSHANLREPGQCIIVGMLKIDESRG
jgi:hypothetical protein